MDLSELQAELEANVGKLEHDARVIEAALRAGESAEAMLAHLRTLFWCVARDKGVSPVDGQELPDE